MRNEENQGFVIEGTLLDVTMEFAGLIHQIYSQINTPAGREEWKGAIQAIVEDGSPVWKTERARELS